MTSYLPVHTTIPLTVKPISNGAGPIARSPPNYLAFVELEMKAAGTLDFETDLRNPDFAKMTEAAGVLGLKANAPEEFRPLLAQALNHPGPALVEVVVDRQKLALPPSIKLDQAKRFSLFMMNP
jgi:pyruvate dehydrogenase (quinone)